MLESIWTGRRSCQSHIELQRRRRCAHLLSSTKLGSFRKPATGSNFSFYFVPKEIRRIIERLGNVCVVRHRVFLSDVGADFEDMTKPFGVAREESTRKCFAEKNRITNAWRLFGVLLFNLCLNDLGSNRNLFVDCLPLRGCKISAHI